MRALSLVACVTIFVSLGVAPCYAWNDRGHMLTAMVAYQELKPEVRERVNAILKDHPQHDLLAAGGPADGPDLDMWIFARAATWPDMVRSSNNPLSGAEHHAKWHYINLPITFDGFEQPTPSAIWDGKSDPENIVQAMAKLTGELKAAGTAADRRAMDLCWVEHLVGDIHQPLHAVSLFSKQFSKGDKGGNSFAVRRGDTPTNMHTYWDSLMGSGTVFSTLKTQVDGFKANSDLSRTRLIAPEGATDMKAWAEESVKIAQESVYRQGVIKGVAHDKGDYSKDTPVLPSDYEQAAKKVAARQVVTAGYRMADSLNKLLSAVVVPTPAAPQ